MKKLILLLILPLLVAFNSNAQITSPAPAAVAAVPVNPNGPVAQWDKLVNDFGDIAFNVPKTVEFTLTNAGKAPLIISSARASCGCTNLKYSQEPILPGKSSIVAATYNAAAQGIFTKTVTVTTNADPNPVVLQFKGTVLPAPAAAAAPAVK
jgi:hypothetical protein